MSARTVEIIRGMPVAEYLAIDAASHSRLRILGTKSPAHLQAALAQPREQTDALTIGEAAHALILEPDTFESRFATGPTDDRRVKAWRDFAKEAGEAGVVALRPKDLEVVQAMKAAVHAHPAARFLLDRATEREVTVLWVDEQTQAVCKARLDLIVPETACTVELKSAHDASRTGFERAIWNHGYYSQGAWYLGATNAVPDWRGQFVNHAIIAFEKEEPYAVNVFLVRDDAIQAGRDQLDGWLRRYAECRAADQWPCESAEYGAQFMDISLPPWAQRSLEERAA